MFAPDAAVHSVSSLRNPRRRQRTNSDDSVKYPKAKRQRSLLREDTFEPPRCSGTECDGYKQSCEAQTSAAPASSSIVSEDNIIAQKQLVLRGPKKADKQGDHTNGTVILSKNDYYIVSQLPSLPDQIRGIESAPPESFFATDQGYALILTQCYAIVWPYAISESFPSPADVFTVMIPDSCRDPSGGTPLGVFVSNTSTELPGLMVVIPSTGKIIYWETVSHAAVLGLVKQKQNGLQGSVPGLLSGERVTEIINAEPSGIIVTLSSGRVAHVAVRDPQGKPTVTVNFLRGMTRISSRGFLGGIKSVLGGSSWRQEVAASRSGESSQRGQRDIIIATSTGLLEIWDTHWNNGNTLKKQVDVKYDICEALGQDHIESGSQHNLKVLDFVCAPWQDNDASDPAIDRAMSLFFLVAVHQSQDLTTLAVVRMTISISTSETRVVSTHPVERQKLPSNLTKLKPRLHIPKPHDTAFIVLGQTVVLLSLTQMKESPSSQLLVDSNRIPVPFQDCIRFRDEEKYKVLGSGFEDQSDEQKHSACLVMVRGFGVIRITVLPRQSPESDFEDAQITAKHKLEQAVFYGNMLDSPLDFVNGNELDFPPQELEQAALDICKELLQSRSKFISSAALSLDQHLRLRAKALDDLALHLMRHGCPSRLTRWQLLWGAEKLAAQRAMWKVEEGFRKKKSGKPTFLARVIELMGEKFKTKYEYQNGESDRVRHWFIHDTYRMEHIIPWIFNAIRDPKGNISRNGRQFSDQVLEASELSLSVLETAFRFREEHAGLYGLGDEPLEDGVLASGYEGLPEFWTSRSVGYAETGHLLDLELDSCRSWLQQTAPRNETPDSHILRQIARNSPRQLRVLGQMHRERVRWLSAQSDSKSTDESLAIETAHLKQRKWQLFKMAGIGQLRDAISLAEEFRDMGALVELIVELQDQAKGRNIHQGVSEEDSCADEDLKRFGQRIASYFDRFGESWADAFFSRQISVGQPGVLLAMRSYQPYVTRFLRKTPGRSRLGWINDIIGENDYNTASRSLENLAIEHEFDLWSQRVEISLAKLTRLASWEKSAAFEQSDVREEIKRLDDHAEIGMVQELVYEHVLPALHGAIDQKAELELAIDHFGKLTENQPSLHEILEDSLGKLVAREVISVEQLVDLLTLMDPVQFLEGEDNGLLGREFYLALHVLRLSGYAHTDPAYYEALQKLVWRRCMIRDNWEVIGETSQKLDDEVESRVRDTALFRTLAECLKEERLEGFDDRHVYTRYSPSEILDHTSHSGFLKSRFRPEHGARILHDLDNEAEILRRYVEKGKLEVWFRDILASVEALVGGSSSTGPATVHLKSQIQRPGVQETLSLSPTRSSDVKTRLNWL
ncbi:hypothetical protein VTN02DRAFT_6182 [Thermoascus thermophilus]